MKIKNPYPQKPQEIVAPFVNKATSNFPPNDPKMGIARLVEINKEIKMAKKADIIARGIELANMREKIVLRK